MALDQKTGMSDHLWSNVPHTIQALTSLMRGRTTSHSSLADTGAAVVRRPRTASGRRVSPPRKLSKAGDNLSKGADTPPRVTDIQQLGWERRYRVTDIAILGADTVFHVTGRPLKATDHGAHRALCRAFALDSVRSSTPRTAARRSRTSAPCSSRRARWCRAAARPWRDCRGSS